MYRREALALVATLSVPLAGCSGGGGGGEDDTGNGSSTTDDSSTGGNSTDADGGDTGGDTDGQSDEQSDGGDPTGEELAQEDVDAAQASLQTAVDELEAQGTSYGTLDGTENGPPVTAALESLSAGPVRDALSTVANDVAAAREHETTSEQEQTLAAIEATKDWMHAVLDAYQPVRDLYLEANYAAQDHAAEDAEADVQATRRAADQAQTPVEDAASPYAIPDAGATGVGGITNAAVQAQADRLAGELESGRSVADAIEGLQGAEEHWEQGATHMEEAEYDDHQEHSDAAGDFEAGMSAYGNISADGLSGSYSEAGDYLECYRSSMEHACERGETSAAYYTSEDYEEAREIYDEARAGRSDALSCSMDWSA